MNCYEKRIKTATRCGVIGSFLAAIGIIVTIVVGITADEYSIIYIFPMMVTIFLLMPVSMGFMYSYIYKIQYRMAKSLLTDEEIQRIEKPMYLQMAITEKAKRLMEQGKASGDMSAYNEFRELVMMSRPMGVYGRYGGYGI